MYSQVIEFSSLRELYDSVVQIDRGEGLTDTVSWEEFKERFQPLLKNTPTEYRHLDVSVSSTGKIVESYDGRRKEINLSQGG
jgi:hypothetical protein